MAGGIKTIWQALDTERKAGQRFAVGSCTRYGRPDRAGPAVTAIQNKDKTKGRPPAAGAFFACAGRVYSTGSSSAAGRGDVMQAGSAARRA